MNWHDFTTESHDLAEIQARSYEFFLVPRLPDDGQGPKTQ
jgi:hypothetical protein